MAPKTHFRPQKKVRLQAFHIFSHPDPGEKSDFKEDGQPVGASLGWANVNLTEEVGKKK